MKKYRNSTFIQGSYLSGLKIKDTQDCKITILSLGKTVPKAVLQKMIALGADEAIALEDPIFEHLDPYNTAAALTRAIQKTGDYHLIFTGRQGADWDAGLTWAGIAEFMDIPSISITRKIEVLDDKIVAERCVADGIEVLETPMPALMTFSNEAGELRNVSLKALMLAKKQQIIKWSASDIGFEKTDVMALEDLYIPDMIQVDCNFMSGETDEEKGRNLAKKCIAEGILLQHA